jgi:hypothetical protein
METHAEYDDTCFIYSLWAILTMENSQNCSGDLFPAKIPMALEKICWEAIGPGAFIGYIWKSAALISLSSNGANELKQGLHPYHMCLLRGGSYAPLISGAREAPPKRARLGPAQLIWVYSLFSNFFFLYYFRK